MSKNLFCDLHPQVFFHFCPHSKKKGCGQKKNCQRERENSKTSFLLDRRAGNTFLTLKTKKIVNFFPNNHFLQSYMFKYLYVGYFSCAFSFPIKDFHALPKLFFKIKKLDCG